MKVPSRKYYAMVPSMFSFEGEPYWLELLKVKTLTSAQCYVDRTLGGPKDAEIGVSINGENKTLIAKKNKEGKWEVVCESKSNESPQLANDQIHYHFHGKLVSKEDFYKYGFQHEK